MAPGSQSECRLTVFFSGSLACFPEIPSAPLAFCRTIRARCRLKSGEETHASMLYPELFKQLEAVRWDMDKDIPWESFTRPS